MKYALFSDIHGSEEGLSLLTKHPDFVQADQRICLGDVINAHQPNGAVDFFKRVNDVCDTVVLGNHEAVLFGGCPIETFNSKHAAAIQDAQKQLGQVSPDFIKTLTALPVVIDFEGVSARHASYSADNPWEHVRYTEDVQRQAHALPRTLNFLGHGHIPFIAWLQDGLWYYQRQIYGKQFSLMSGATYVVNVGSVLGSREMRAYERTFVIFDSSNLTLDFHNLCEEDI